MDADIHIYFFQTLLVCPLILGKPEKRKMGMVSWGITNENRCTSISFDWVA